MTNLVVLSSGGELSGALAIDFLPADGHQIVSIESGLEPPDAETTIRLIRGCEADVVVLEAKASVERWVELATRVRADQPDLPVLLVAASLAGVAGVAGVIAGFIRPTEVETKLSLLVSSAVRLDENRVDGLVRSDNRRRVGDGLGRVIATVSPKGGCGKTTVATNLAVGIAAATGDPVALIDADLQFGDVNTALGLPPSPTIADVLEVGLSPLSLKFRLHTHPSGVSVLAAPTRPEEADRVGARQLGRCIDLLAETFGHVVVDTEAGLLEHTLSVLDRSTDHVLVSATDVAAVRGLAKAVDALDRLDMGDVHRHHVLNRADAKVGLSAEEAEAHLGIEFDVQIPSSRDVPTSLNEGRAVIDRDPGGAPAKALRQLVSRFVDVSDDGDSKGFFRRRS